MSPGTILDSKPKTQLNYFSTKLPQAQTHARLNIALATAHQRYTTANPTSSRLHVEATSHLPGGNTRSVLHASPFPLYITSGTGNTLLDADGHHYLDLVGDMTAGLFGHSQLKIQMTLVKTISSVGLNLGATTSTESQFAAVIKERVKCIEQLRFCNSGTEANLYALIIAKIHTRRRKVLVFKGAYHGGVLGFAAGVAVNNVDRDEWLIGKYNDVAGLRELITQHKGELAAVLVEGMMGAGGGIPGSAEFLHAIQDECRFNSIIFILDEVMTFRLAPSGLQSTILHPITHQPLSPDLTTLGKNIAGGIGIGAFGGRADLMAVYDPRTSPVPHSGTFNNNSLAMACGLVALPQIYTPSACLELNALGDELRARLNEVGAGTKMKVTGLGAVNTVHFVPNPAAEIRSVEDLEVDYGGFEEALRGLFYFWAIEKGYWVATRGLISLILGTTREEVEGFVEVVREFVEEYRDALRV
ncbi:acetylornithine aminotransferase [Mytilinidion resinicola]|uniref:Acetylornithine aminotransferase n=1 Tax=Mytilinidion resinicola TaxID=574789 RepID=A0A6A6YHZ8_9PEZI|nr:acetylornithine aminotransferase [Mytilinidion resinicola]KAF2808153.1 acetylornithine aminotransferase [Mytilinidion resinicola]